MPGGFVCCQMSHSTRANQLTVLYRMSENVTMVERRSNIKSWQISSVGQDNSNIVVDVLDLHDDGTGIRCELCECAQQYFARLSNMAN